MIYGEIYSEHVRYITRNVLLSAQMGERASVVLICITSTECKTLKGERRMIFIFNIITALNYNQDRGIFCPCGKDALSLPVLIIK